MSKDFDTQLLLSERNGTLEWKFDRNNFLSWEKSPVQRKGNIFYYTGNEQPKTLKCGGNV